MLKQIEGSRTVAEAVAMCRPEVICAYPITPQTHIVEALSATVKKGEPPCDSNLTATASAFRHATPQGPWSRGRAG
jgi:pyruvate/2-oxoacid:ferredoxin oxidoreductase alpha subunit